MSPGGISGYPLFSGNQCISRRFGFRLLTAVYTEGVLDRLQIQIRALQITKLAETMTVSS